MLIIFKALGALIGARMAPLFGVSPIAGLFVGLFLGHSLDAGVQARLSRSRAERFYKSQVKAEMGRRFLESLFLMFGKLALADGPITTQERQAVERLMVEALVIPRRARKAAMDIFKQAFRSPTSFQYDAVQFFELHRNDQTILLSALELLLTVAASDGPINPAEFRLIQAATQMFSIPAELFDRLADRHAFQPGVRETRSERWAENGGSQSRAYSERASAEGAEPPRQTQVKNLDYFYSVLGCERSDSIPTIKQKYRKLVADYHPDKIISKNLPEDFNKFAHEKFKSIQEAYEAVKVARGFN